MLTVNRAESEVRLNVWRKLYVGSQGTPSSWHGSRNLEHQNTASILRHTFCQYCLNTVSTCIKVVKCTLITYNDIMDHGSINKDTYFNAKQKHLGCKKGKVNQK